MGATLCGEQNKNANYEHRLNHDIPTDGTNDPHYRTNDQLLHTQKDNRFYAKTTDHDEVKRDIVKNINPGKGNQKEYNNGNVKVSLF